MPLVSIVIPVLNDFDAIAGLLRQLPADPRIEIVVVAAMYDAQLDGVVGAHPNARLIRSTPGRAHQMNAGAALASGEWILFLHADSRLPAGWLERFAELPDDVSGGWFAFALGDESWQARVIEWGVAWRVRTFALPYGDQGLFTRRALFVRLGGYTDLPLMEDVEFVRRLRRVARLVEVPLPLVTSARRWHRDGWFRRSARNVVLVLLYFAGVSPSWLAKRY